LTDVSVNIICFNEQNGCIHLREEGSGILFCVVFLLILISQNLCAFYGRDSVNCGANRVKRMRTMAKIMTFAK